MSRLFLPRNLPPLLRLPLSTPHIRLHPTITTTSARTRTYSTTPPTPPPPPPPPPPPGSDKSSDSGPSFGKYKTLQAAKSRYRSGPFSWKAGLLFLLSGGLLIQYFRLERERLERKRIAEQAKGVGRPKVGGEFVLTDMFGKEVTQELYKGRYALVYFGFTHCPDICPEELDKMSDMLDLVEQKCGNVVTPLFITCDPARDSPEVLKEYLSEFHPKMIGLTGTYDQIKSVCKAYRVYFSTPPVIKPGQDYLVDHSIYFYLMDPEGDFVEALGRQHTPQAAAEVITGHIKDWKQPLKRDDSELYAPAPKALAAK